MRGGRGFLSRNGCVAGVLGAEVGGKEGEPARGRELACGMFEFADVMR